MFKTLILVMQSIALGFGVASRVSQIHDKEKFYHASYFNNQDIMQNFATNMIDPVKDSYVSVYFSHLNENIPYNVKGTCSFVALSMLLSFYDNYMNSYILWDDMKVPTVVNIDDEIISRDFQSPGVTYAPLNEIKNLSNSAYISYVENHCYDYLDMLLMESAYELYGTYYLDSKSNPFGLGYAQQADLIDYYLWRDCHIGTNLTPNYLPYGTPESDLVNKIKERIDAGHPVIVNAQYLNFGGHTAVAYDYDEDNIYVHFGWKDENGNALNHVSIYDMGCTRIESIVYCDLPDGAVPYVRQNYQKDLGNGSTKILDIETLENPTDVKFNKLDNNYYIEWKSLMDDPFINLSGNKKVSVEILDCDNDECIYFINAINQKRINIPRSVCNQLVDANGEYEFKVRLKQNIKNDEYFKKDFYLTNKNKHVADMSIINSPYYTSTTIYAEYTSVDGLEFQVKGKSFAKESNALALTSRKNNSRDSYVDLYFPRGVTEISFDMAFYSKADYNYFYNNKGQLYIEEFKHGKYSKVYDFIESHDKISSNKSKYTKKTIKFDETTFKIRIHVKSQNLTSVSGTVQGRILIKKINVVSGRNNCLPCNGYELDFNPNFAFNGTDYGGYNCYNYALNIAEYPHRFETLQPGEIGDPAGYAQANRDRTYYNLDTIALLAYKDSLPGAIDVDGYTFREIDAEDIAAPDCYKIALVLTASYCGGTDYHWMRQNSDGTWSHKPGGTRTIDRDIDGNRIYHPETVVLGDRNYGSYYDANEGIKFFEVSVEKQLKIY